MTGAILQLEMLLGSRRSRAYAFRWLYAGLLLVEVVGLLMWYGILYLTSDPEALATHWLQFVSKYFILMFITQQQILLLIAVPILTASAVTEEKTTGTLQYFFTTELSSLDVILGKLFARLIQCGMLVLVGYPLLFFFGGLGYLEPLTVVGVLLVTLMPMFALGSASLLASVWFKKTSDAVLTLYGVGLGLYALVWGLGRLVGVTPLSVFDPHYLLAPIWEGTGTGGLVEFGVRLVEGAVVWVVPGLVCLGLAVWRLRPAYIRQLEGEGKKRPERWWRVARAPISENPVVWKERHVEGLAPVKSFKQVPTWLAAVAIFLATVGVCLLILVNDLRARSALLGVDRLAQARAAVRDLNLAALPAALSPFEASPEMVFWFSCMSLSAMLLFSLVVGIRCSAAISGEREKKTWEALLLTPLPTKKIVGGKLWGILGASYLYLIAYAVPALLFSFLGDVPCVLTTFIWTGVIWLAMTFIGSAGVWCSVRARSSWRSLLSTLGLGYLGGGVVYGATTPFLFVFAMFFGLLLTALVALVHRLFGVVDPNQMNMTGPMWMRGFEIGSCLTLAGMFALLSWLFYRDSIKWVADRERTRFWKDEPRTLPPVRRRSADRRPYRAR
jgi:ABC-type transport system involved in multi-copper enzyme maturation permease subunit